MANQVRYNSWNEDGLLTDVTEVRDISLLIIEMHKALLGHPLVALLMSGEGLFMAATATVVAEAALKPMSEAQANREVGVILGMSPDLVERAIQLQGASETEPISRNGGVDRGVLGGMDKPEDGPLTVLPDTLQQFLDGLSTNRGEIGNEFEGV
jgi:hypothetical protein